MTKKDDFLKDCPTLRGFVTEERGHHHIHVFCPFCDKFHHHGWSEGETKKAHRAQHCTGGRPYDRGYLIAPFTKKDLAEFVKKPKAKVKNARIHLDN